MQAITQTFAETQDKEHFLQAFGQFMMATLAGNAAQPWRLLLPRRRPRSRRRRLRQAHLQAGRQRRPVPRLRPRTAMGGCSSGPP